VKIHGVGSRTIRMGLMCRNRAKGLDSFWLVFVSRVLARQGERYFFDGLKADLHVIGVVGQKCQITPRASAHLTYG
jgi:hypothetical protein